MDILNFGVAMAQTSGAAAKGPSTFEFLLFPAIMFIAIYFFMIRPQTKKMREHQNMMKALKAGDEVVTSGGFIGKVKSIAESFVTLELSAGNNVKIMKSNITGLTKPIPKAAPAKAATPKKA